MDASTERSRSMRPLLEAPDRRERRTGIVVLDELMKRWGDAVRTLPMRERATVDRRWSRVCAYENAISLEHRGRSEGFRRALAKTGSSPPAARSGSTAFVSLAARYRDRRAKKSLRSLRFLHRLPGVRKASRTAGCLQDPSHDGAAVHEERTADGCEHPLGVRETKVTNKPWSRSRNRLPDCS